MMLTLEPYPIKRVMQWLVLDRQVATPMNFNIVICIVIFANSIHVLIRDTVYGNVLDYISLPALMIIMHGLTPISYTLYFS